MAWLEEVHLVYVLGGGLGGEITSPTAWLEAVHLVEVVRGCGHE